MGRPRPSSRLCCLVLRGSLCSDTLPVRFDPPGSQVMLKAVVLLLPGRGRGRRLPHPQGSWLLVLRVARHPTPTWLNIWNAYQCGLHGGAAHFQDGFRDSSQDLVRLTVPSVPATHAPALDLVRLSPVPTAHPSADIGSGFNDYRSRAQRLSQKTGVFLVLGARSRAADMAPASLCALHPARAARAAWFAFDRSRWAPAKTHCLNLNQTPGESFQTAGERESRCSSRCFSPRISSVDALVHRGQCHRDDSGHRRARLGRRLVVPNHAGGTNRRPSRALRWPLSSRWHWPLVRKRRRCRRQGARCRRAHLRR